jgi:O-antigen/teichoic acid export membrane protein
MTSPRSVLKNTFTQILGRVFSLVCSLILTVALTRPFGETGYGVYVFVSTLVLLFGTVSDWGTNIIAVREVSRRQFSNSGFFGILIFRLLLSVLATVVLNVLVRVNPSWESYILPVTVASLVLVFLSLKTSFAILFQSTLRLDLMAWVDAFSSGSFLFLVWLILLKGADLTLVFWAWVFATFFSFVLALYLARDLWRFEGLNWAPVGRLVKEALPTGLLLLVFSAYNRLDVVILQHFSGDAAVGIYGLSYKIYENALLLAAFVMNSLFPVLAGAFGQKTNKDLQVSYQRTFSVLLALALTASTGMFLFSAVVVYMGGVGFSDSGAVLRILALGLIFSYMNHLTGYSLIAFGRQRISLLIACAALLLNLVVNFLLFPPTLFGLLRGQLLQRSSLC